LCARGYPAETITAVRRLGMNPETLRKWIRQTAVDGRQALGSREFAREVSEFKRKISFSPAKNGRISYWPRSVAPDVTFL